MQWKPFRYDVKLGASLGASYRVDCWFVHKTFSLELSAELHLWGPEIHGKMKISWYIISFTISFSKGSDNSQNELSWTEFKDSFLKSSSAVQLAAADSSDDVVTLNITGITGKTSDEINIIAPNELEVSFISKIPENGNIRPMNSTEVKSDISLEIYDSFGKCINDSFTSEKVTDNLPAAMWKSSSGDALNGEALVKNVACGLKYKINTDKKQPELFLKNSFVSLDELYGSNTLVFDNSFEFTDGKIPELSDCESLSVFSDNACSNETAENRREFLRKFGITEEINISKLAEDASNQFCENILIKVTEV
jgi:hypothetical protein